MDDIADVLARCQQEMTAPGAPFELDEARLDGRTVKVYRHAPRTLPEFLDAGRAHGEREFMVYEGERWSFTRFYAAVDAFAAVLAAQFGVRAGTRVAIAMRNRPEWAVAFAAVASLGAVPAPVNSFGMREELLDALQQIEPRVLVCDLDRFKRLEGEPGVPGCEIVLADAEPMPHSGVHSMKALLAAAPGKAAQPRAAGVSPDVGPDDPALLLFTSGATSRAKGVLSTQRAVCQALFNLDYIGAVAAKSSPAMIGAMIQRGFAPTTLMAVPLFHVSGLHAQLLASLRHGRRLVLMHRWDPVRALDLIREERVTQFNGAPSMLMQLLEEPGIADPEVMRSLSGFGAGGAGLPQRTIERLTSFSDRLAGVGFGMTETNGVGAGASGEAFRLNPRCSGVVSPIIEVRIVSAQGETCASGDAGEIWLRGVSLMSQYWRNPGATAEALTPDGWLRTGDVGYVDTHGQLYVVDRIKDVINRNGEKIAAAEVESCLMQHPEVREAAVFGVPDEKAGEAVAAVVVTQEGSALSAEAIGEHVRAHLAAYKAPSYVYLRSEALPRNPAGKLLKGELKESYRAS
ncbi:long-chain acyl-CoA synthetase [Paraburkholderia unamae]|uniref:class I adenylate-forming enzyme family protein n=1 Tax=Paraburkholderia unamae TaxID=219649 RepID=UPI000DC1FE6D|nr:class I adenylate-forming enzyme family protein [Paraburkholderia unamae]RAR57295.1 long-chain acyl-CoA synthetase [Paraburkholderia unamae]